MAVCSRVLGTETKRHKQPKVGLSVTSAHEAVSTALTRSCSRQQVLYRNSLNQNKVLILPASR